VIIIGRGGGSIEDLWAFNEEIVARAVYNSQTPVISAVGHETDFTIADFTADLRAPTPTAAAEVAVPDKSMLRGILLERAEALQRAVFELLSDQRWTLQQTGSRLQRISPENRLAAARQSVDELFRRAERAVSNHTGLQRTRLNGLSQQLHALNPQNVLGRGYAVVSMDEKLVTSQHDIQPGDQLRVQVRDGEFRAKVTGKDPENE
jgi:exodeoxyribonuclease VII large subunit